MIGNKGRTSRARKRMQQQLKRRAAANPGGRAAKRYSGLTARKAKQAQALRNAALAGRRTRPTGKVNSQRAKMANTIKKLLG